MNIEELLEQRKRLEEDLMTIIGSRLSDFTSVTGISIKCVNVNLYNAQIIGDRRPGYILTSVKCEIDI